MVGPINLTGRGLTQ